MACGRNDRRVKRAVKWKGMERRFSVGWLRVGDNRVPAFGTGGETGGSEIDAAALSGVAKVS